MIVQGREGLSVGICHEHGAWLDTGELEALVPHQTLDTAGF